MWTVLEIYLSATKHEIPTINYVLYNVWITITSTLWLIWNRKRQEINNRASRDETCPRVISMLLYVTETVLCTTVRQPTFSPAWDTNNQLTCESQFLVSDDWHWNRHRHEIKGRASRVWSCHVKVTFIFFCTWLWRMYTVWIYVDQHSVQYKIPTTSSREYHHYLYSSWRLEVVTVTR